MEKSIRLSDILGEELGQPELRLHRAHAPSPFGWSASAPSTGFASLDEYLGGIPDEGLVLIGARPGVGKTSFMVDLAINTAKQGVLVVFFTLELGARSLAQRFLSAEARVGLESLRNHAYGKHGERISSAGKTLSSLEIYINDTPAPSLADIEFLVDERLVAAREISTDYQKALVVIDYLELVQIDDDENSYFSSRAAISAGLKALSGKLGCPVVSACQISKTMEYRRNKKPCACDFRGVEQDADIALLIYRSRDVEEWQNPLMPDRGTAEIIIAKNRWGHIGSIQLGYDEKFARFCGQ